jgi:uncharacterized membrane protein YraQ (UPF0718 family)
MGVARTVGAVVFSVVIGSIMSLIYRKEEKKKKEEQMNIVAPPEKRPMWQTSFHFFTLVLILVFANWGAPSSTDTTSAWHYIFEYKWAITGFFTLMLGYSWSCNHFFNIFHLFPKVSPYCAYVGGNYCTRSYYSNG